MVLGSIAVAGFLFSCFFFNDTATTEIYTLSLHDALPISCALSSPGPLVCSDAQPSEARRSEEHTSELQSHHDLVCRLLLEKKNTNISGDPVLNNKLPPSNISIKNVLR